MKDTLFYVLCFAAITSCGQKNQKNDAIKYYGSFSEIFYAYKLGIENFMKNSENMMAPRLKDETVVLTKKDSVSVKRIITDFDSLTNATVNKLNSLPEFDNNDLKMDALNFVKASSEIARNAFGQVLLKDRGTLVKEKTMVVEGFRLGINNLVELNKKIRESQVAFLNKYDIPIEN
ncbi:MAG: hypothetical protein ACKOE6_11910 [Flammeovirgaceae bacterium]